MARPPFGSSTPNPPMPPAGARPPGPPAIRPLGGQGAPGGNERRTLVVGRGISLQGLVQDAERLVVEGTVEAQMIHAMELAVSPGGVFKGEIEVRGCGNRRHGGWHGHRQGQPDRSRQRRRAGTARCRRLQVEDGGQITGRIEMINEPVRHAAPRPAEPAGRRSLLLFLSKEGQGLCPWTPLGTRPQTPFVLAAPPTGSPWKWGLGTSPQRGSRGQKPLGLAALRKQTRRLEWQHRLHPGCREPPHIQALMHREQPLAVQRRLDHRAGVGRAHPSGSHAHAPTGRDRHGCGGPGARPFGATPPAVAARNPRRCRRAGSAGRRRTPRRCAAGHYRAPTWPPPRARVTSPSR